MNGWDRYQLNQIEQTYSGSAYGGKVDIARVYQLVYMAERDIVPDGTWSDNEVGLWEAFRRLYCHEE